jgi:predicted nucleotidyltransferase
MENKMINKVKDIVNKSIKQPNILAVIPYGSTVYKNKTSSDYDFVVIVDGENYQDIHGRDDIDITILGKNKFIQECNSHTVRSMELLFTPFETENLFISDTLKSEICLLRKQKIDRGKIRENFSRTTSNSYVKAKKKIIVKEDFDYMTSLKSLWHSIRITDFAIQIIEKGSIDFSSMNLLYKDIEQDYKNYSSDNKNEMWKSLNLKYKPIFNNKHSAFKALCPKNIVKKHSI